MKRNSYIIVGDAYHGFSDGINVMTTSELYEHLSRGDLDTQEETTVHLGQGICESMKGNLRTALNKLGVKNIIGHSPPIGCDLTHKITEDNVLISNQRIHNRHQHDYDLIVNDKVDRLSDHVTGQHISAMLIMEAARQATISILELAYMYEGNPRYGLSLNSYKSEFLGFLFPVAATLEVILTEKNRPSSKRCNVIVDINVIQSDKKVATISLDVALIEKNKLDHLEAKYASKVIEELGTKKCF